MIPILDTTFGYHFWIPSPDYLETKIPSQLHGLPDFKILRIPSFSLLYPKLQSWVMLVSSVMIFEVGYIGE